jgi:MoaA/NifB/PqqE/SkfB family radical SAM enzyme
MVVDGNPQDAQTTCSTSATEVAERCAMPNSSSARSGNQVRDPGLWETIREHVVGVRRSLDWIQVEVTSRCPGGCVYCPHTTMGDRWRSCDMDMETFTLLWPLMRRARRVHLQGWGEPLLNPAFFAMAALAGKAGCAVSTTTSGLIMNEEMALKLVKASLDIVAFSLAGTDAASNASRHGVDFDRVCNAVSVLQNLRRVRRAVHLKIHVAYLMLASTMEAMRGLPGLMHRLGVDAAVVSTLDYIPSAALEPEGFAPHQAQKLARAKALFRETEAEAGHLGVGFHWALPQPDAPGTTCRENIDRSLFVGADGAVSPCCYLNFPAGGLDPRRRVFGNVREQDPLEIWESVDFRRFRERLAGGDPDFPCMACPKRFSS